jgi:hypothetical protein
LGSTTNVPASDRLTISTLIWLPIPPGTSTCVYRKPHMGMSESKEKIISA